ncbi:hypothetical protein LWR84_21120 [Escherichia coli]|uniref:hypothetical protein n=1 Tax=Escherichia coli TaxID=562 RepID=UPI00200FBD55|nr:hypothetical protein [Escherichia coli]MCL0918236.1 hypothetical protein [Escherichia coli]
MPIPVTAMGLPGMVIPGVQADFVNGKRMNMPWWGGFDPRAWDVASLMDFAVPVVACLLVWLLVNRG